MTLSIESLHQAFKTLKGRAFYGPLCEVTDRWIEARNTESLNALLRGIQPAEGAAPYNCVAVLRNVYSVRVDLIEYWPLVERVQAYLPAAVGKEMTHKYLRGGLVKRPQPQDPPPRSSLGLDAFASIMACVDQHRRLFISDDEHEAAFQHLERRRKEHATVAELDADPKLQSLAQAYGVHSWAEFARQTDRHL